MGAALPLPTSLSGAFMKLGVQRVAGGIATYWKPCAMPRLVAISKFFHAKVPPNS